VTTAPNRHAVDELSDIRARIKILREREQQLRAVILADPEDRAGDEFVAVIGEITTERLDVDLMKAELGLLFLRPYIRAKIQTRVRLEPKPKKTKGK
jgi:hypothetical protein